MKPAPFELAQPRTVDEALAVLAEHGPDAAVLAGGQSLLLDLRYRRRSPRVVVDLNRVAGLDAVEVGAASGPDGGSGGGAGGGAVLRLGALARHAVMEQLAARGLDDPLADLAADAARKVGHPPVRARGTVVGSIAWANPCAEWCALAVTTGARVHLRSARGSRVVDAGAFFRGPCDTVRADDELLTGLDVPHLGPGAGAGFLEHRRTSASYAMVAAFAVVVLDEDGAVGSARLGVAGAGPVPLRAAAAEAALVGRPPGPAVLAEAAAAAADAADPVDEPHASARYRRHVVGVLARRALEQAVRRAAPAAEPSEEAAA